MKCNGLVWLGLAVVLWSSHAPLNIQAQEGFTGTEESELGITEKTYGTEDRVMDITGEMYGVSLNAGAVTAILPEKIATGSEDKGKFPVYTASYSSKESDCLEKADDIYGYCGIRIPIKLPEKGQIFVEFVGTQDVVKKSLRMGISSDSQDTGTFLSNPELLTRSPEKTDVLNAGTYYLVFSTYTDFRPEHASFTTNSLSFRVYYYSAADKTLSSGKWTAMAEREEYSNGERYYKVVLPENGHIQIQSDIDRPIAICNSNKKVIHDGNRLDSDNNHKASYYLKKGTYYIKAAGIYDSVSKLRYDYYKLGTSPFVLQNGKMLKLYATKDKSVVHYIKYKATATGYITVTLSGEASGEVALCNSSLKAVSGAAKLYGNMSLPKSVLFNVKKGQTYYLKANNFYASEINLRLTVKSISEKSGSSKKKAVKLQSGKNAKGVVELGNKKGDWYKFTVEKKKNIKITVKGRINGGIQAIVYPASGKKLVSAKTYDWEEGSNNAYALGEGLKNLGLSLKKGTYYIKILGKNTKSSGYYTLKWK